MGSDSTLLTLCLQKQRVNTGLCSLQWMFSCLHCASLKEWSTESFLCRLWPSNEKWPVGKGYWIPKKGNPSTFLFTRSRLFNGSVNYGVFIPSLDCQLLKNFWEFLRTSVISLSECCAFPSFSVPFIHGACMECPLPRIVADAGIISQSLCGVFLQAWVLTSSMLG